MVNIEWCMSTTNTRPTDGKLDAVLSTAILPHLLLRALLSALKPPSSKSWKPGNGFGAGRAASRKSWKPGNGFGAGKPGMDLVLAGRLKEAVQAFAEQAALAVTLAASQVGLHDQVADALVEALFVGV